MMLAPYRTFEFGIVGNRLESIHSKHLLGLPYRTFEFGIVGNFGCVFGCGCGFRCPYRTFEFGIVGNNPRRSVFSLSPIATLPNLRVRNSWKRHLRPKQQLHHQTTLPNLRVRNSWKQTFYHHFVRLSFLIPYRTFEFGIVGNFLASSFD